MELILSGNQLIQDSNSPENAHFTPKLPRFLRKFRLFGKEADQFRQEDELLRKNVEAPASDSMSDLEVQRYLEDLHIHLPPKT